MRLGALAVCSLVALAAVPAHADLLIVKSDDLRQYDAPIAAFRALTTTSRRP